MASENENNLKPVAQENEGNPYECKICFERFSSVGTLNHHKRSIHNFKCDICEVSFQSKNPILLLHCDRSYIKYLQSTIQNKSSGYFSSMASLQSSSLIFKRDLLLALFFDQLDAMFFNISTDRSSAYPQLVPHVPQPAINLI